MSLRIALLFFTTCLFLGGCATTTGPKTYLYQPPTDTEGQKCILACKQSRALCKNTCNPGAKQCLLDAKKEHEQYVEKREVMGLTAPQTLKQFVQAKQCSPKQCGCDTDYRSCYELCGGAVEPN